MSKRPRRLFDAWADLDPTGITRAVVGTARRVPLLREWERLAEDLERRLLGDVHDRVVEVLALTSPSESSSGSPPVGELLGALLTQSAVDGFDESRAREYVRIVEQLGADEARILAALSDGTRFAVLDVIETGAVRRPDRVLLANASDVGRRAGVMFPQQVPAYVSHLVGLGVADIGGEDPELATRYEVLEAEPRVQTARRLAVGSRLPPANIRKTLEISEFGLGLWEAAKEPSNETTTKR